jgi:hypothetical protein
MAQQFPVHQAQQAFLFAPLLANSAPNEPSPPGVSDGTLSPPPTLQGVTQPLFGDGLGGREMLS